MRSIYARVVLGVVVSVAAGFIAAGLLVPRLAGFFQEGAGRDLIGNRLPWIAVRLESLPQSRWPDELARIQPQVRMPLRIMEPAELPEEVRSQVSGDRPAFVSSAGGGSPYIYAPVRGGAFFLVGGPLPRPPLIPFLGPALVFALVLTVTASAVVGVPLVRRLRSLRQAIGELGDGNWATRLDANAEGALGELAESINRMAGQLQAQFAEREALLQTVSHELGTPLARMRFEIELLEGSLQTREQRQRLATLSADLDELDQLSTELVAWMEPNAQRQRKETFEAAPVLDSLVEIECCRRRTPLNVEVQVPPWLHIVADQRQFQRAIENLLRNALRYAQQKIVVEAIQENEAVVVEVRDDGPGISQDQRVRVLEPFARIEGSASASHRGLGLGLAIVRRIVEAHGGKVSVSEAPEGGTLVRTTWP